MVRAETARPPGCGKPAGWRRYNGGLVTEVSILSASVRPVEGRARVVLLQRSTATSALPADGEVIHLPTRCHLRRPGGQVLGVR